MISESEKRSLLHGAGVMIGEAIFGLNGPFLFQRFGLNPPEAAAVGSLVGALAGWQAAEGLFHLLNRKHAPSTANQPHGAVPLHHA